MSIAEKLTTIAENQQKVYEAVEEIIKKQEELLEYQDELISNFPPLITVMSCISEGQYESSGRMAKIMSNVYNDTLEDYVVKVVTPKQENETYKENFKRCWNGTGECLITHFHGNAQGLYDEVYTDTGIMTTPEIITRDEIKNDIEQNTNIYFVFMSSCSVAGDPNTSTPDDDDDNIACAISSKINPSGVVIANSDILAGYVESDDGLCWGYNEEPTWKLYKNGVLVENAISDIKLTFAQAYDYYIKYKE